MSFNCWEFSPIHKKLLDLANLYKLPTAVLNEEGLDARNKIIYKAAEIAAKELAQSFFDSIKVESDHQLSKFEEYNIKYLNILYNEDSDDDDEEFPTHEFKNIFWLVTLKYAKQKSVEAFLDQLK